MAPIISSRISPNGQDWTQVTSAARNAHITADEYGFAFYNNAGGTFHANAYSWLAQ